MQFKIMPPVRYQQVKICKASRLATFRDETGLLVNIRDKNARGKLGDGTTATRVYVHRAPALLGRTAFWNSGIMVDGDALNGRPGVVVEKLGSRGKGTQRFRDLRFFSPPRCTGSTPVPVSRRGMATSLRVEIDLKGEIFLPYEN